MMSSITKKILAQKMDVSISKLQKLLNHDWYEELVRVGYQRRLKILSPRMLEVVINNWGDFDE